MNIIGVGRAGCKISDYLSTYPTYKTYQVDTEDDNYRNFIQAQPYDDHEAYENNYTVLKFGKMEGDITVILTGAGRISGMILRMLEQISDGATVDILYIKPRVSEMSSIQMTRHKICSQVLQQYARSKMIKSITMVDNEKVEAIVPNIDIDNYWQPINRLIGDTFHMTNVLQNTEALLKSNNQVPSTAKIRTLSVVDFEEKKEEVFYDLEFPRAKNFYLALSEEYVRDNKDLLTEVRTYVAEQQTEKCDCAYAIYKTDYEQNYVYGIHHATLVQEQNLDL
jgi:hypothetical protein